MKLQNVFTSAAMLVIFVLATLSLVIRLVQFVVETVQTILVAILFVAKIACKAVKVIQRLLSSFEWALSAIQGVFEFVHSSLEDWMVSTIPSEPTDDRPTPTDDRPTPTLLLVSANPFPSERTAFEKSAIAFLKPIAPTKPILILIGANPFPLERTAFEYPAQPVIASSLELVIPESEAINSQSIAPKSQTATSSLELSVAPTETLMLTPAATFSSERTVFEYHAISAIACSLELAIVEPVEVITKPLGKVITIGKSTELTPLSFPGVYVQRTPKKKPIKGELSKLTIPQLRELIAEAVKNNNSLVVPKSKAKKAVLVDWLMAN